MPWVCGEAAVKLILYFQETCNIFAGNLYYICHETYNVFAVKPILYLQWNLHYIGSETCIIFAENLYYICSETFIIFAVQLILYFPTSFELPVTCINFPLLSQKTQPVKSQGGEAKAYSRVYFWNFVNNLRKNIN